MPTPPLQGRGVGEQGEALQIHKQPWGPSPLPSLTALPGGPLAPGGPTVPGAPYLEAEV